MKKYWIVGAVCAVLVLGAVAFATAAMPPQTGDVTVTATVPEIFSLSVANGAVAFGTLLEGDLAGITSGTKPRVEVHSNKKWHFDYSTPGFVGIGGGTMAIGSLAQAITGGGADAAYSILSTPLGLSGNLRPANSVAKGISTYDIEYTLTPGYAADPDDYTAVITYTATQN
ncbi:MAG TPA: hypothetical protein VF902_02340 [Coriobacteriia bacterium]